MIAADFLDRAFCSVKQRVNEAWKVSYYGTTSSDTACWTPLLCSHPDPIDPVAVFLFVSYKILKLVDPYGRTLVSSSVNRISTSGLHPFEKGMQGIFLPINS